MYLCHIMSTHRVAKQLVIPLIDVSTFQANNKQNYIDQTNTNKILNTICELYEKTEKPYKLKDITFTGSVAKSTLYCQ